MCARSRREAEIAVVRAPQPRSSAVAVAGATERRLPGALEVPIEQVVPDLSQPRQDWAHDDGSQRLAELTASVREFGILQPILVREEGTLDDGRQRYMIIAGARRHAAADSAGLATVPVVVRGEEAARLRILQLIENLQRQNLSPLDEARAYQELIDVESLTPPQLAERLHISAQQVRDRLRVLADQVLADAVQRRQISMTAARDIKKLPDDVVMTFRTRILAGDHLQTNDVAAARARLVAEGIINPRRKSTREKQTSFVPANVPSVPTAVRTEEAEKQTTFVPAAEAELSGRSTALSLSDSPALPSLLTRPALTTEVRLSAAEFAQFLAAALEGERRRLVQAELAGMRDHAQRQEWWLQVYDELQAALEHSDVQA